VDCELLPSAAPLPSAIDFGFPAPRHSPHNPGLRGAKAAKPPERWIFVQRWKHTKTEDVSRNSINKSRHLVEFKQQILGFREN